MGAFAILEPRPEVQPPGNGPTGGDIAARLERSPDGGGEMGIAPQGDLVAGKEAVEVGDVPMLLLGRRGIPIFQPFLQLALPSDLIRGQPRPQAPEPVAKIRIHAEGVG